MEPAYAVGSYLGTEDLPTGLLDRLRRLKPRSDQSRRGFFVPLSSMGHQHRDRHRLEDGAGRATQHNLPQPRMAIGAHHD